MQGADVELQNALKVINSDAKLHSTLTANNSCTFNTMFFAIMEIQIPRITI